MEAIIERAAGLDVHQGSVVACVILSTAGRRTSREPQTFGAMRQNLAALRDWLREKGVTRVGIEATGVHWQPVHAALEGAFMVIGGTPRTCATCPGARRTWMLQRSVGFADLGADHLGRIDKHRTAKRLVRRLDALGYDVMLRPKVTA